MYSLLGKHAGQAKLMQANYLAHQASLLCGLNYTACEWLNKCWIETT